MSRKSSSDFSPGSRHADTTFLILASLADGEKHGYSLTKDVESFAGVRLAPGTLYEALARLEGMGLIEPVASDDRRRPYRLTAFGATALAEHVAAQTKILAESQRRLKRNWSPA
jgi:DNA-binding PadR family transcriptional regulator